MNRTRSAPIFAIIALIFVVALADGLDQWINFLRLENSSRAANPFLTLWVYTTGNLLLAALLLALFTWLIRRLPRHRWVAAAYLLVGLAISVFPLLYFSPLAFFMMYANFSPRSFLFTTGGILACTGLAILLDPLHRSAAARRSPEPLDKTA